MSKIAFLGLGAMGARMARRLLAAGHDLTVYNRSSAAAAPLVEAGARMAATPAEAVDGVEAAFAMLRDDRASEAVWLAPETGALAHLPEGAVAVDCSTLSTPFVRRLAAEASTRGRAFLDAPLAGSRPQAEAGQLIFFVGGEAATLARVEPWLRAMGGGVHHAGPAGAGATVKLMVNALFGAQLAMLGELIGLTERAGLDPARAIEILGATPVASPAAKGSAAAMLAGAFAPAFPIDLVAKDFELIAATSDALGAETPLSAAVGALYASARAEGLGADNITGIVQRYRR